MKKSDSIKKILLSVYLFILIFQPPILPVPTIYFFGIIVAFLLVYEDRGKLRYYIMNQSGMLWLFKVFSALAIYVIFVSIIDLISGGISVFENRLQCMNQLLILPGIQFIGIGYFFKKCKKYCFGLQDVIHMISIAGALQGMCSIGAYLIPDIRTIFLKYNGEIYKEIYVFERRGYGFSGILLDLFGYGMGLIAGMTLLSKSFMFWQKIVIIPLCFASILLNARTGLVVFIVAFILYLLKSNSLSIFALKSVMALNVLYILWYIILPIVLEELVTSSLTTLNWFGLGFQGFYYLLNGDIDASDASFLSSFIYPDSISTQLLGTGHNVYGISNVIGFHSDVGYINYLWEFGLIGTGIMFLAFAKIYVDCFKAASGNDKFIVLFLAISYMVVLFKGVLLGYNPGSVVNYLLCFAIIFNASSMNGKRNFLCDRNYKKL